MNDKKTHLDYRGEELALFALATNWKKYWATVLARYVTGNVAEVGAGLGANTLMMWSAARTEGWCCIEPDPLMANHLEQMQRLGQLPERCVVHSGILSDISRTLRFDTIVYIDVLEHIEDDCRELSEAAAHLNEGGRIVVLGPAWQHLFTPFDHQIGHFRRYTKQRLCKTMTDLEVEDAFYLDSVGYFASLMNKVLMRQSIPTRSQVLMWDTLMIPISRVLDRIICRQLGRSVVGAWRKAEGE